MTRARQERASARGSGAAPPASWPPAPGLCREQGKDRLTRGLYLCLEGLELLLPLLQLLLLVEQVTCTQHQRKRRAPRRLTESGQDRGGGRCARPSSEGPGRVEEVTLQGHGLQGREASGWSTTRKHLHPDAFVESARLGSLDVLADHRLPEYVLHRSLHLTQPLTKQSSSKSLLPRRRSQRIPGPTWLARVPNSSKPS